MIPKRGIVPNLVLAQRVIDKMVAAAQHFIEDETGEAMVGLITPGPHADGVPTIYILDTIPPDESAVRQLHTFQQGDDQQAEIFWWLQENWRVQRQKRRGAFSNILQNKWDVPLSHLGDWHKQPGFMIAPSGGDLMTALNWLDDDESSKEFLLSPIVTLGHPSTTASSDARVNYLAVPLPDGTAMRVDFWYIHRDIGMFQPINPAVYPDDQLPELTPYPWHLTDEVRVAAEFDRFAVNDMAVTPLISDADGEAPLEFCITAARSTVNKIFLIATAWNYPAVKPQVRLMDFVSMGADKTIADMFTEWWLKAQPAPEPAHFTWTPGRYLMDYIEAIEQEMGIAAEDEQP